VKDFIYGLTDILKYPYKQLSKLAIEFYTPANVIYTKKELYYELPLNVEDLFTWRGIIKKNYAPEFPISLKGDKIYTIILSDSKFLEYCLVELYKESNLVFSNNFLNVYIDTKINNSFDKIKIINNNLSDIRIELVVFTISDTI